MKIKLQLLAILTIFVLVFPAMISAESPRPSIPLLVYGNVTIDGQSASLNTEISSEIDNMEVAVGIMIEEGIYFIEIPDGKINEGKIIKFKVDGIISDNQLLSVNIDTIPSIKFNLAVTTLTPTPLVGGGGGGGGGTTTPSSNDETGDINRDSKVDKYDFALMMANWEKIGSNDSDLNDDNKVNKYDFALLMVNWSPK